MALKSAFIIIFSLLLPIRALAEVTISVTPTADNVLPGGIRSIYSNVQGDANTSVSWTASGGSLASATGYTTWTAPAGPGIYTITATSVADTTKSAVTRFTVSTAAIRLSNIPMQVTVYKNQPVIIQSILWGSTNTSVAWSSSGGTLTGTGREVVFSSSTAGTYTVTATSSADNSKTATTTVVVTGNTWPGKATPNKTQPVDCTPTGSGTTYDVTTEAQMDAVPWSALRPGDTVRIHAGTVYHRQLLISTSGTDSQPIRICGVPDGNGNLPELNGANATAKPGSQFGTGAGDIQMYGGITVYNYGAAYYGGANYPKNIIIEGLKLTGYNHGNTFTDLSTGLITAYSNGAACIRIQRGGKITLRGNDISGCGNGYFTMAKNGIESNITRDLLVEGNYFHGNGVVGDYLEHQNYLQAFGLVVQGNYYDYSLPGSPGGQLKSRSVQQFVRYNFFEPAARIIDLVEEQDDTPLVFPWVGLDPGELPFTSPSDVVANLEAYQNQYIYGNIIHNTGNRATSWMVHGAADTGSQDTNYGGIVYFYNNTIYHSIPSNIAWRSGIFDFGPYQTAVSTHTVWPTARVTNNAIYLDSAVSPSPTTFFWNRYMADRIMLDKNWVSSSWGTGYMAGGDGTGIANATVSTANVWQGGQQATQVSGLSNLITGTSLPFNQTTYIPIGDGPLVNSNDSLPGKAATLPPLMQYSPVTLVMSPRPNRQDIGAQAYASGSSDVTAPVRSNGSPIGTLPAGTTSIVMSLFTDEYATCKYGTNAAIAYSSIVNSFATTGGTSHSQTLTGLSNGSLYTYYVRCQDGFGNANADDFTISFSVASGGTGPRPNPPSSLRITLY